MVQADSTSTTYPFRVLEISNGSPVQISNVTIKDGHSTATTEDGDGGGIEVLSGSLTMRNSTVTANTADSDGGGIYVAGLNSDQQFPRAPRARHTSKNVTISDNSAAIDRRRPRRRRPGDHGKASVTSNTVTGSLSDGAGIRLGDDGELLPEPLRKRLHRGRQHAARPVAVAFSTFGSLALTGGAIGGPSSADGNHAFIGAGLDNAQVATLHDVTVQHNAVLSGGNGGGIDNNDRLSITGGSLSHNQAQSGGGLNNETGGHATLQNVNVSRNAVIRGRRPFQRRQPVGQRRVDRRKLRPTMAVAFFNDNGSANIKGTSITGNSALREGGGIVSFAPLSLTRVQLGTVVQPNVAQEGGGIFTEQHRGHDRALDDRGNRARNAGGGSGGGVFDEFGADDELRQTTVSGNTSDGCRRRHHHRRGNDDHPHVDDLRQRGHRRGH